MDANTDGDDPLERGSEGSVERRLIPGNKILGGWAQSVLLEVSFKLFFFLFFSFVKTLRKT